MQSQSSSAPTRPNGGLLTAYRAQVAAGGGHIDEMLDKGGTVKPVWTAFFAHLDQLGTDELTRQFARGDQYLRDAGVLYRQYDETLSSEREWPLSHVPVLLGEDEWQSLSAGLIERAELLEFVLRDFYTDNKLVASGQLPASLLARNRAWLRPMVGAVSPDTPVLNTLSFEVGRGPDGRWWVISDLVEAPSTAGFTIENRIAMNRVFPNYLNAANIHRLAGYFDDFQQNLFDIKGSDAGEIAILSPGPMNQNYAEHAYLARYLGLLLVEGEDLIVQGGKTMVRTVDGTKPVSLLWSRLPSAMMDPLELDPVSMLGTAGMVQAVRDGALKTVNMIGAGVLETRALMAFLPKIARARLGRGLTLPNIATWWCGQEAQRAHVLAHSGRMMVGNAFSTTPLMADPSTTPPNSDPRALEQLLKTSGRNLVGQEAVTLSTTPAFYDGALLPRPMCVRISLGRTKDGWAVMPGGYARISAGADAKALAMQQGGRVADVWITSRTPLPAQTLLSQEKKAIPRSSDHVLLPSRAADNLFWLGRYVERSEQNMRLFRAYYARISDGADHTAALLAHMRARLMDNVAPRTGAMAQRFSTPLALGLKSAARISDRFSPDGMMALRDLVQQMQALDKQSVALADIPVQISNLLRQTAGFAGLVHENMYRSDGWRFLSLGVSLERAANMCAVLAACTDGRAPVGAYDLALEIGDSVVSHRARFVVWANAASVIELLCLDPQNPRSVRYHISRAKEHIASLPRQDPTLGITQVAQLVLRVETRLATAQPAEVTPAFLAAMRQDIWDISTALTDYYLV